MNDEVGAVGTALYNHLKSGTVISIVGTAGIYKNFGSRDSAHPLVVFNYVTDRTEYFTNTKLVSQTWTVKGVSHTHGSDEAERVAGFIDRTLQEANLTITGGTLVYCRRHPGTSFSFRDEAQFWHAGRNYIIRFETSL